MSYERDNAFEEAARIAEKWRDENKAAAAKARKRESRLDAMGMDHPGMAEMLEGAAMECNAIAQTIRELKGTPSAGTGWREKYADYMRSCGPMSQAEADALAIEAFQASGDQDPEETASSDLACMREDEA